jgi:hypothetical protein
MLEKLLLARYIKAVGREKNFGGSAREIAFRRILSLKDRIPVHSHIDNKGNWIRKMYWPKMGLLTHHWPLPKKKILKKAKIKNGKSIRKLLDSNNLSYYNNGITKMEHKWN